MLDTTAYKIARVIELARTTDQLSGWGPTVESLLNDLNNIAADNIAVATVGFPTPTDTERNVVSDDINQWARAAVELTVATAQTKAAKRLELVRITDSLAEKYGNDIFLTSEKTLGILRRSFHTHANSKALANTFKLLRSELQEGGLER